MSQVANVKKPLKMTPFRKVEVTEEVRVRQHLQCHTCLQGLDILLLQNLWV